MHYLNTLPNYIATPFLIDYTILIHCRFIPYLNTLSRTIHYLNTLSRTIPYLISFNRNIPYLNTLRRTITYLNTFSRTHPVCAQNRKNVGSQSESSTKRNFQLHQPIRVEYYVTRVVSQSESGITSPESGITSPESSRLGWKTPLGSRLLLARYSLS